MPSSRPVVPITLITGFLGAGKTTLVNRMLRQADGLRLAVLVNDFGAINIDAELIEGITEDVIALRNGCICCSLTSGLLAAVSSVLRREQRPDAIIIEGSGVTDPFEVMRALSDPELQAHAPLDGILTVVDAAGIADLDEDALSLTQRQISTADLVLLNKIDLVDQTALQGIENQVAALAPGARIIHCINAEVPLAVLLGVAGANGEAGKQRAGGSSLIMRAEDVFESVVIEQSEPIALQRLHNLLSSLPSRVYRVKGILHLAERADTRCILQATGRRAAIKIGQSWSSQPPSSQIVFVAAKGTLDASLIKSRLNDHGASTKVLY